MKRQKPPKKRGKKVLNLCSAWEKNQPCLYILIYKYLFFQKLYGRLEFARRGNNVFWSSLKNIIIIMQKLHDTIHHLSFLYVYIIDTLIKREHNYSTFHLINWTVMINLNLLHFYSLKGTNLLFFSHLQ